MTANRESSWFAALRSGLLPFAFLATLAALTVSLPAPERPVLAGANETIQPGTLPLGFVPNRGQSPPAIRYQAEGPGYGLYFKRDRVVLSLAGPRRGAALELLFEGARGVGPTARDRAAGIVSYLGGDSAQRSLPNYSEVVYKGLWPGVDLSFRAVAGRLKYEFLVRPGADVSNINLRYRGARGLVRTGGGGLAVETPAGVLRDSAPRTYQMHDGRRSAVASRFRVSGSAAFGFEVGAHDPRRPLVIDPGIAYSALIRSAMAQGVAVDRRGNAYLTGEAIVGLPTTPGAFDPTTQIGSHNAFVAKLSPNGSELVYATYLGGSGSGDSRGFDVAVDDDGAAYVTGDTVAADFPTTPGAYDTEYSRVEAFVTKLSPDGSRLEYSTFFGGPTLDPSEFHNDTAFGIEVDSAGNAFVVGSTNSEHLPLTPNAVIRNHAISAGFLIKLDPAGSELLYSTYLPSTQYSSQDLALDRHGAMYVTGTNLFEDVPVTPGAFDPDGPARFESATDAYAMKIASDGSLGYATYFGGTDDDRGFGIAVDAAGAAYLTGDTTSVDLPTSSAAHDPTINGGHDLYLAKLSPSGAQLVYGTYIGGSSYDGGSGVDVEVDAAGQAIVTAHTASRDLPVTPGAADTTHSGASDGFLTRLNPAGGLSYSTYLPGGSSNEIPRDIALDLRGDPYVAGEGGSGYPTTPGAHRSGEAGAFAVKLDLPPADPATITLAPGTATNTVGEEHCVTATVGDASGDPVAGTSVRFSITGVHAGDGEAETDANGEARFCYRGELLGADLITAFADFNPADGARDAFAFPPEPGTEATKQWVAPPPCEGRLTGAGSIITDTRDRASFNVSVRSNKRGEVRGTVRYRDPGSLDLRTFDILSLSCNDDGQATVFGRDGNDAFRLDATDLGRPGRGRDQLRILHGGGYDSGLRTLVSGNLNLKP